MAKKEIGQIKLQLAGGQATPAPPVGPALGQYGLNIMDFCKAFNARTAKDTEGVVKFSNLVVDYGNELLALHQAYNLEPSQELVDLIETHKKLGEKA